jgi:DNA-binding MarR family transcriptional regulator
VTDTHTVAGKPTAGHPAGEQPERTATAARLRVAIGRLARRLRNQNSGGLSASQLSTLVVVEKHAGIRLGHLAALEGISASSMTRLVAGLTDAGLLDRRPDPDDGRSVHVSLSANGKRRLDQIRRDRTMLLTERIHRLEEEDYDLLVRALPILETLLRDTPPITATGIPQANDTP